MEKSRSRRGFLCIAFLSALFHSTTCMDHQVGGAQGWTMGVNQPAWAQNTQFLVGDTLTFVYEPFHDVLEVPQDHYEKCTTGNSFKRYQGGKTTIPLTQPGTRYFICGIPGHCIAGMKIKVDVVSSLATFTAPPPASPVGSPPLLSPVSSSPLPTPSGASQPPPSSGTTPTDQSTPQLATPFYIVYASPPPPSTPDAPETSPLPSPPDTPDETSPSPSPPSPDASNKTSSSQAPAPMASPFYIIYASPPPPPFPGTPEASPSPPPSLDTPEASPSTTPSSSPASPSPSSLASPPNAETPSSPPSLDTPVPSPSNVTPPEMAPTPAYAPAPTEAKTPENAPAPKVAKTPKHAPPPPKVTKTPPKNNKNPTVPAASTSLVPGPAPGTSPSAAFARSRVMDVAMGVFIAILTALIL